MCQFVFSLDLRTISYMYFEEMTNFENQSNHFKSDTIYNIFRLNNSYFRFPLPCLKSLENEVRDKQGVFGVR